MAIDNQFQKEEEGKFFLRNDPNFRTGTIFLPDLEVSVVLGPNRFYAEVISPTLEEGHNYMLDPHEMPRKTYGSAVGVSRRIHEELKYDDGTIEENFGYLNIIMGDRDDLNIRITRAHENAHFLDNVGRRDLIYGRIGITEPGLDREEFAHLCELLAFHQMGKDVRDLGIRDPTPEQIARQNKVRPMFMNAIAGTGQAYTAQIKYA